MLGCRSLGSLRFPSDFSLISLTFLSFGYRFLGHPPIRRFTVDVGDHPLTANLPARFDVADEP